jgi:hypothetical protein
MAKRKKPAKTGTVRAVGRPEHEPTEQNRATVEAMIGYGIPQDEIAEVLGIARRTLAKHYAREIKVGSTKANAKVVESLYQSAVNGGAAQQIWWTKIRCGWKETQRHELTGADGKELPNLRPIVFVDNGRLDGDGDAS